MVASLGVAMRARPMPDLGPGVEVHHLTAPDLGTRMTDFSRTADHLALGRSAAADLLERLACTETLPPLRWAVARVARTLRPGGLTLRPRAGLNGPMSVHCEAIGPVLTVTIDRPDVRNAVDRAHRRRPSPTRSARSTPTTP